MLTGQSAEALGEESICISAAVSRTHCSQAATVWQGATKIFWRPTNFIFLARRTSPSSTQGAGCGAAGCRVQGAGCSVLGAGCRVLGFQLRK